MYRCEWVCERSSKSQINVDSLLISDLSWARQASIALVRCSLDINHVIVNHACYILLTSDILSMIQSQETWFSWCREVHSLRHFCATTSEGKSKSINWIDTMQTESECKGREKIACRAVAMVRGIDYLIRYLVGIVKTRITLRDRGARKRSRNI